MEKRPDGSNAPFKIPSGEKWLDIGCGLDKIPGALGIDRMKLESVDIVHDLNIVPWPFSDNAFDHVVCKHSINQLNDAVQTIEEIWRILKPNGILEILAPHYSSDNFNTDPTHRIHLGIRSMNYFCENLHTDFHYYSKCRFLILQKNISFRENRTVYRQKTKFNPAQYLGFELLINFFPRIYERFFVYFFPAGEIYFKMQALK